MHGADNVHYYRVIFIYGPIMSESMFKRYFDFIFEHKLKYFEIKTDKSRVGYGNIRINSF